MMRRREVIKLLGGAAVWPIAARAQQAGKSPTIGFLGATTPTIWSPFVGAFLQRLRELGWTDGRNIAIEYRWAEARPERYAEISAEFVRLKVDVIVTSGTAAVLAAKQATSILPIVFAAAGNPVDTGIVASLARPGGNVTGLSNQASDTVGKRLELLREVIPGIHRLAILANIGSPIGVLQMHEAQAAASSLGLAATTLEIRQAEDIASAFEALIRGQPEALYVVSDLLTTNNRVRIITLAQSVRLPTISDFREWVEAGALMSYGANFPDLFRRAAAFVDKILHGAKPADLPVEQPTKFDLAVNLTTAKALGIEVPPTLLAIANEVIE